MSRFARIANQRIYQQIVDQISGMIRDGSLRPGDRLPPERQLAEEFGVSRAAVREALSALDLMGLIEVRQGEGTFVRNVTEEALVTPLALLVAMMRDEGLGLDMVEVRAALEAEAAYLAAQRREPEDLVAMEDAIAEMEAALRTGDLAAEADWKFHHAIASASGNGMLLHIMRTLSETMQESIVRFRTGLLRIPGMDTVLLAEHQGILDAIRDRDAKAAHDRMRAHLDRVRQMLYGKLSATANERQR